MLGILALAVLSMPKPPFHRVWTDFLGTEVSDACVMDQVAYVSSVRLVESIALPSGRVLWQRSIPAGGADTHLDASGGRLFLSVSNYRNGDYTGWLEEMNPRTGAPLWRMSVSGEQAQPILVTGDAVFIVLPGGFLTALDPITRRTKWQTRLEGDDGKPDDPYRKPLLHKGILLVSLRRSDVVAALDAKTGKPIWRAENPYGPALPIAAGSVVATSTKQNLIGRDLRTGKVLWKAPGGFFSVAEALRGRLAVFGGDDIALIDPVTGKVVRKFPTGNNVTGSSGGTLGDTLLIQDDDYIASDAAGRMLWRTGGLDGLIPIWTDGKTLVMRDRNRVLAYRSGLLPPLPTGSDARRALAERLVAHFELIDGAERHRLKLLAPESVEPLLRRMIAIENRRGNSSHTEGSSELDSQAGDIARLLHQTVSPAAAPAIVKALEDPDLSFRTQRTLLQLLLEKPDPKLAKPLFSKMFQSIPRDRWRADDPILSLLLAGVMRSPSDEDVNLLIQEMQDPAADGEVREQIYANAAAGGNPRIVATILSQRKKVEPLPRLEERVRAEYRKDPKRALVQRATDAAGRTWVLIQSGQLGNYQDLWIGQEVDGSPIHPVFTGMTLVTPGGFFKDESGQKFHGKPVKEVLAGDWVGALTGAPEIWRDQDGDGLTDLEEARLGTSPTAKDTDGDGRDDAVDPWPTVAGHAETDEDRALAAIFDVMYHFDECGPAVFEFPPNIKPFELPGRNNACVLSGQGTMAAQYEYGIAMIDLSPMGRDEKAPRLVWNQDHTEVQALVSTYYGGLNGSGVMVTLRKFGNEWVPVGKAVQFVS